MTLFAPEQGLGHIPIIGMWKFGQPNSCATFGKRRGNDENHCLPTVVAGSRISSSLTGAQDRAPLRTSIFGAISISSRGHLLARQGPVKFGVSLLEIFLAGM